MFRKRRELRSRYNVVCLDKRRWELQWNCLYLAEHFCFLKTLERHWSFVNCEVIGSSICFKKLITSNGRMFESGGTQLRASSGDFGLLHKSASHEDGKEGLKSENIKSMIYRK